MSPETRGGQTPPRLRLPRPRFDHLLGLTHRHGVWEHTKLDRPRVEHGFCTDDAARALLVAVRGAAADPRLVGASTGYLRCVREALTDDGGFHNRRAADGRWIDRRGSDDAQGRALWALGVAVREAANARMRREALAVFEAGAGVDSPHLRTNAFAVLGAVEVLAHDPTRRTARDLLRRCAGRLADAADSRSPWPEPRLSYDNARLPEALLAAGATLGDRALTGLGLRLLAWLVAAETRDGHFSFTPVGGRPLADPTPGFDQQPVEAVAMAEACHRASRVTGDPVWSDRAVLAAEWLLGRNDTGAVLYDRSTGATFDGLERHGVNRNRGAESTLAGLAALLVASRTGVVAASVTASRS